MWPSQPAHVMNARNIGMGIFRDVRQPFTDLVREHAHNHRGSRPGPRVIVAPLGKERHRVTRETMLIPVVRYWVHTPWRRVSNDGSRTMTLLNARSPRKGREGKETARSALALTLRLCDWSIRNDHPPCRPLLLPAPWRSARNHDLRFAAPESLRTRYQVSQGREPNPKALVADRAKWFSSLVRHHIRTFRHHPRHLELA